MCKKNKSVATMQVNESATIQSFQDEAIGVKLATMGVLPQSKVTLVRKAPWNDPFYIKVNDSQAIAIRKSEAQTILVD